jgi:hypothetical protein
MSADHMGDHARLLTLRKRENLCFLPPDALSGGWIYPSRALPALKATLYFERLCAPFGVYLIIEFPVGWQQRLCLNGSGQVDAPRSHWVFQVRKAL